MLRLFGFALLPCGHAVTIRAVNDPTQKSCISSLGNVFNCFLGKQTTEQHDEQPGFLTFDDHFEETVGAVDEKIHVDTVKEYHLKRLRESKHSSLRSNNSSASTLVSEPEIHYNHTAQSNDNSEETTDEQIDDNDRNIFELDEDVQDELALEEEKKNVVEQEVKPHNINTPVNLPTGRELYNHLDRQELCHELYTKLAQIIFDMGKVLQDYDCFYIDEPTQAVVQVQEAALRQLRKKRSIVDRLLIEDKFVEAFQELQEIINDDGPQE